VSRFSKSKPTHLVGGFGKGGNQQLKTGVERKAKVKKQHEKRKPCTRDRKKGRSGKGIKQTKRKD